jgi:aminoglycoside 6'-N-acetyltransferase
MTLTARWLGGVRSRYLNRAAPVSARPELPGPAYAGPVLPTLTGATVVLRPLVSADRERIGSILAEPEVARWWGQGGPDLAVDGWFEDIANTFAIEADGAVVGSIQFSEELDPDYRSAGIDLFLETAAQDRGLGRDAVRTLARYLFEERGHHRIAIDPSAANARAIRAYRAVGFRPVGLMRRYERGPDGTWHDGLLLDLLPDELNPAEGPARA